MSRTVSLTDHVVVSRPCPVAWKSMAGDDRTRFCAHCKLHVHNLSAMPESDVARLIHGAPAGLCVRFFRDKNSRSITLDRPRELARARRHRLWGQRLTRAARMAVCVGLGGLFARFATGCAGTAEMLGELRCPDPVDPAQADSGPSTEA